MFLEDLKKHRNYKTESPYIKKFRDDEWIGKPSWMPKKEYLELLEELEPKKETKVQKNFTTLEVGSWYRAVNYSLIQIKERGEDNSGEVRFVDTAGVVYSESGVFLYESLVGNNSSLVEKVLLDIQVAPRKVKVERQVKAHLLVYIPALGGEKTLPPGEYKVVSESYSPLAVGKGHLTKVLVEGTYEVELDDPEPSDIPF